MLDIKNMTDEQIVNLIKLSKHELETRRTNKPYMFPTGVIKLTLESSITNDKGQVFQNEPKTIFYETMNKNDIDAIFNERFQYILFVNQLVEHFKQEMWENQTGPLKLTRDEIHQLQHIIFRVQHTLISENDSQLLEKLLTILGGK